MLTAHFNLIPSKRLLAAVIAGGCIAAAMLVQQFYRAQWNALAEEKGSELMAIAQVKASAIASWRRERLGDVQAVSTNTALGRSVREALAAPPSPAVEAGLRGWLQNLDSPDGDCHILLYDPAGRKRLSSTEVSPAVEEHGRSLALEAIRQRRVVVEDFHLQDASIHLMAAAPLLEERGQVVGAISLQIEPERALYRLVESWPTPSRTGETLLVRRDGNEVTFLNELRHRKGTALRLKLPMGSRDLPAAIAAAGKEAILEGVDYRGVQVLAATRRIPDSPWFLVAKVDRSEVEETAQNRTAYFGAVTVLIVMVCGFSLLLGWSRSESRHYRRMYQAETEHRAVVSHYEQIHQHANDIMLLVDETGRIVEVNERASQKYGYPRDELLRMTIGDLRDPTGLTGLTEQWQAAASEDGVVFETVHRRAGGAVFPVEVSSRVIGVDGHQYRQSIVRDISERKRAEQALVDARNQLETALDIAGLGPAELDVRTGMLTFSQKACAIFGFEQPQQSRDAWLERIHPEDRERVRYQVQSGIQQDAASLLEYRFYGPDGRIRWASARGISITGPDGARRRFSVTQDITERKQGEQALRESEQRFRAAFEHAAVGMLVVDAQGMLQSVNHTLCEMLRYSRDELVGKHFQEITHPDDRAVGAETVRRFAAGELTHVAFEKRYVRKDGSILWGLVSSAVLRDSPGAPMELITQIQDVTERKQAEEALREKSARLEELTGALNVSHAIVQSPDGEIRYWSRGAAAMYGWSETEATGRRAAELLQTEFPCPFGEIRSQLEHTGEWEGELRQHRQDGTPVVVASHWSLQRDIRGRATAIVEVDNDITALKCTEEALQVAHREREQYLAQLEAVLNNLTEGIVVSDLEGNLLHWNPAALALHGFRSAEESGRRVPDFADTFELSTADGVLPVHDWPVPRILRGETLRGFEARLHRRGEDWSRIFSYAGALARSGNGEPILAVLSITDVTASRAAEQALREREADLNRAQAVARMGSWRFDGSEFRWSDESYRMFGIAKGTLLTRETFTSAVHPDDRALVESCPRGEPYDMEYRIIVGGDVKWVHGQGQLECGSDGRLISGFGTVQDITESRKAEDALKQALAEAEAARRLLNAMMDHIPLGIAVSDAREPGVVYMSRYARDLVQRSTEELLDAGTWRAAGRPQSPVDADEIPLARARKRGEVVKAEEWMLTRRDGVTLPILSTAAPIRDAEGRIIGAVAAWQDMTERKQAELEIRQLNAELEQRVRDRTAQLEAANKELEAFSYSVSHDLRAPLRGIDGWSLALLEDYGQLLDDQARRYLDRVRSESQRMGLLIDDLLQLSRVTRAQMRRDPVDLTSLAQRIAGKVRESYDGRSIEFGVAPGLRVEGDAGLLEVTLTNLFDNAAKFTSLRPAARIEFGRLDGDAEAVFYVRDNGVGFDLAYADKLFGAFQRLHKASEFPGTGIGLATVQRVVRRHGGRIWAESRPGDGATFYFTLGEPS